MARELLEKVLANVVSEKAELRILQKDARNHAQSIANKSREKKDNEEEKWINILSEALIKETESIKDLQTNRRQVKITLNPNPEP